MRSRGNPLTRLIIFIAVIGVVMTFMGLSDVVKDAFGTLADFTDLKKDDFRSGDIIHGRITETIGCAAERTESHYHRRGRTTYTKYYYYVVPFFGSDNSPVPEKVMLYCTANSSDINTLNTLSAQTVDWYCGKRSGTDAAVTVERAEVCGMSNDEYDAFVDFVDKFLDAYYKGESEADILMIKNGYLNAMVPFVVTYRARTDLFLIIGLVALGLLAVIFIVISVKNRMRSPSPEYTYIGAGDPNFDPNLNAPTGLKNASDDPYFNGDRKNAMKEKMFGLLRTREASDILSRRTERPMSPLSEGIAEVMNKRRETMLEREMNFDPYTGKPLKKPAAPMGDSMPSVDPRSEENVDLSNGGVLPEDKAQREFVMPFNGAIPVINPESAHNPAMFAGDTPAEPLAETSADAVQDIPAAQVTPIRPSTSADNMKLDFQVEQTDPSMRGMMPGAPGGEMNSVDPYTEKNVDVSNGGIEIEDDAQTRLAAFPSAAENAAPPEDLFASAPMPDISFPTAEPIKPAEPVKEPDGYNIFKTQSSSYNIFKTDDNPADNGTTGFPEEKNFPGEKSFPKPDKSFPTPGESDVGGQDDFIF